jgi:hypothetical protein
MAKKNTRQIKNEKKSKKNIKTFLKLYKQLLNHYLIITYQIDLSFFTIILNQIKFTCYVNNEIRTRKTILHSAKPLHSVNILSAKKSTS